MMGYYVQFGCGLEAPSGWINFDNSPTLRLQKLMLAGWIFQKVLSPRFPSNILYGDIIKGLPLPPESCIGLYCSHVLEHLSLLDCRMALVNAFNLLKQQGIFRLVVPDLERAVKTYCSSSEEDAAYTFMKETGLGCEKRPGTGSIIDRLRFLFGHSSHLWMWDFKALCKELTYAGFKSIRLAEFGDSEDPMFSAVENIERWKGSIGVECKKT